MILLVALIGVVVLVKRERREPPVPVAGPNEPSPEEDRAAADVARLA